MYNCKCHKCINSCDCNDKDEILEDSCEYVDNFNSCYDKCECGFDEEYNWFPASPMLAQSYVPIQRLDKTFTPEVGLKMGTIFPELVSPYCPEQSMDEITFIRQSNTIKGGCNDV